MKTLFLAVSAIVTLVAWGGPAQALHFQVPNGGVICSSEQVLRQHYYEYDNGLPLTVLTESDTFRGKGKGGSCTFNLMQIANPPLALLVRHNSFCAIRVISAPEFPEAEKYIYWVHCLALDFSR